MPITAAHEAHGGRDWRATYDALAPSRPDLTPADLARLADAAWWLGDSPESMAVSEELYQRLIAAGSEADAADRALRLTMQWFSRGDVQVAYAWLARARRLLSTLPRCALHGYLAYVDGSVDMDVTGDPEAAATAAAEVRACSRDFADPALESFALALGGMAEVRRGSTAAGFADLDEAMLPVLAGHVDPLWSGDLYCTVIHLCDELADLARMRAWTDAIARWSTPRSTTFMFAGVTRIHELQLIAAEGDWDTVEHELGDRSADLVGAHGWLAGEGYYALGEVRRLRGDSGRRAGGLQPGRAARPRPATGPGAAARDEGRAAEALAQLRISLADAARSGARPCSPWPSTLLSTPGTGLRRALAAELEETAGRFGTAGCARWPPRPRAAARLLRSANRPRPPAAAGGGGQVYRDQRHRYASAQIHERLAAAHRLLGDPPGPRPRRRPRSRSTRRLGAAPDVDAARLPQPRPGGLTDREVEVLRLVATGASNQQVADALTISGKTVSRHLANIFTKIGVSSRTAAAAWARDHSL